MDNCFGEKKRGKVWKNNVKGSWMKKMIGIIMWEMWQISSSLCRQR